MSRVKRADTQPEIELRRALWAMRLRFFKDRRILGRRVDIAFPRARLAVFVDGCFWHGCAQHWRLPAKNRAYWHQKMRMVRNRDTLDTSVLAIAGWRVIRLWEHDIVTTPHVAAREIQRILQECRP